MYMKEVPSTIYFPTQTNFGVPPHGGSSNSGIGSNTIDSIFHFGNNEQQVCGEAIIYHSLELFSIKFFDELIFVLKFDK